MVKVKICGITNLDDARAACDLGADALGFIFHEKSPRYIRPGDTAAIIRQLPPFVTPVGVCVNMPLEAVRGLCAKVPLAALQLHGEESPEYCAQVPRPAIKVFRVRDAFDTAVLQKYQVAAFLFDTLSADGYGGTGRTFNWDIARNAKRYGRVVLSGGLRPDNVSAAVEQVQPYAVDVCSGVEAEPGKKDHRKLRAFFKAVRG